MIPAVGDTVWYTRAENIVLAAMVLEVQPTLVEGDRYDRAEFMVILRVYPPRSAALTTEWIPFTMSREGSKESVGKWCWRRGRTP